MMANRAQDWLAQGRHDIDHAKHALDDGDYEWACFAAQQGAEKSVKGLVLALGGEGWGHSITRLLTDLAHRHAVPPALLSASKRLDKHYLPTRYPNGFDVGAPKDYYTEEEASDAISDAEQIYDFCKLSIH